MSDIHRMAKATCNSHIQFTCTQLARSSAHKIMISSVYLHLAPFSRYEHLF